MNPVAEVKTNPNAAPESGSANGGKTLDTNSNKSTAPATQKGTKLTFGATAGMPRRFKGNFDYQFVRTMGCVTYDGAALGECYETASRIEDEKEDSYTEAWRVTAERVEAIARKSLAGGHLVSAREAFLRASSYWREVGFYQSTTDPKCRASWERQRDCFTQAGKLMDLPFEVVSIPYENGKSLPGYFLKADASNKPRPTLMSLGGADSLGGGTLFLGRRRGGASPGIQRLAVRDSGAARCDVFESRCRAVLSAGHRGSTEIRLRLGARSRGCRSETPCLSRLEHGRVLCAEGSRFREADKGLHCKHDHAELAECGSGNARVTGGSALPQRS